LQQVQGRVEEYRKRIMELERERDKDRTELARAREEGNDLERARQREKLEAATHAQALAHELQALQRQLQQVSVQRDDAKTQLAHAHGRETEAAEALQRAQETAAQAASSEQHAREESLRAAREAELARQESAELHKTVLELQTRLSQLEWLRMKENLLQVELSDAIVVMEGEVRRLDATLAQAPPALNAVIAQANAQAAAAGSLSSAMHAGGDKQSAVAVGEMMVLRDELRVAQERLEVFVCVRTRARALFTRRLACAIRCRPLLVHRDCMCACAGRKGASRNWSHAVLTC
jgi:chromosome segregation ATPase